MMSVSLKLEWSGSDPIEGLLTALHIETLLFRDGGYKELKVEYIAGKYCIFSVWEDKLWWEAL